jgi:hypothetical protein
MAEISQLARERKWIDTFLSGSWPKGALENAMENTSSTLSQERALEMANQRTVRRHRLLIIESHWSALVLLPKLAGIGSAQYQHLLIRDEHRQT